MNLAEVSARLGRLKSASRGLRSVDSKSKARVLEESARLLKERQASLLDANCKDLAALSSAATAAFKDRLTLNEKRIDQMAESLRQVAAFPDPVGEVVERKTLKNGLNVRRVRSPLGVIFMIFESRPNVSIEAFSLAFKAGNALILRGGKESMRTTEALYELLSDALESQNMPADCLWGVTDSDRKLVEHLLQQKSRIDVVVPRGGDALIEFVTKTSQIPVIKNDRGMCHVYVHEDADQEMALAIIENSKTQRPGVCNAMETVLVHEGIAETFLPKLHERLISAHVQWLGCARTCEILRGRSDVTPAEPASWDTEYLDFKMNSRVVTSLDQAIEHIEAHGSKHSESIVTASAEFARRFEEEIDAAAVYWNASTRFTDGFELGLGGELGISTQKLHVRGPVGLRELTSVRWIIEGKGQIRSG